MKLISYLHQGRARIGAMHPGRTDRFIHLAGADAALPDDMVALLASGTEALELARATVAGAVQDPAAPWLSIADIRLLPVVPRPGKIVCVGLNYADHAKEGGNARPAYPDFFLRGATSLVAHGQPMIRPQVSDRFDYEAELAVVIGRSTRHATRETALDAVAGYACFNDGTLRDYQKRTSQWTIGKNFDATGAFGPWLVTPDELPPGAAGIDIGSQLDGAVLQRANTRDMLWPVAEIIVLLTECLTLEPGDVIATGTPAGVGYARRPPVFMRPGQTIEIEIEGIGRLTNRIEAEGGATPQAGHELPGRERSAS